MMIALTPKVESSLFRSRLYAVLSRGFLYPTAALLRELKHYPAELCEAMEALPGVEGLAPCLDELEAGPALEQDYQALFGGQVPACPPYETEYTGKNVWMQTQQMADIAGFYRAFGVDSQETGERVDSVTAELEFMYLLCLKEAIAEHEENAAAAQLCRDAQAKFVTEHLAVWLPRFLTRLEQVGAEGYYPVLVGLTAGFVAAEASRLSDCPEEGSPCVS